MGRGSASRNRQPLAPVIRERGSHEARLELAQVHAFADAISRITDMTIGGEEAFRLARGVPVPALDLVYGQHAEISRAHGRLMRSCGAESVIARGTTPGAVPVRVVELTRSRAHLHALIASITFLVQATTKADPTVSIPSSMRDGLIGEGLADAYFNWQGWESVTGIGAFYRRRAGTYGARLNHGTGLDHLFRRARPDGSFTYAAVETKVCRSDGSLDAYLRRQFENERLATAGAESLAAPPLSVAWIADRLDRAYVSGALAPTDHAAARLALSRGEMQRIAVLIACPDYDRPSRTHIPDPDGLSIATLAGARPLADEVVTLRVPKTLLTTLVNDISNARARSIATIALKPRSTPARLWRQIDGG